MKKIILLSTAIILLTLPIIFLKEEVKEGVISENVSLLKPTPSPTPIPTSKILDSSYHIFQTFNNCGPASLSIALSYFDIKVSQKELGDSLRPYQNEKGDNDDKSVTLEELGKEAEKYELAYFHRPNGDIDKIIKFINLDLPVITRTWTKTNEDIGHFRVVKGYDQNSLEIIQDDSLQGKDLRYSYSEFNILWEKFNYEYLVLVPKDKVGQVEKILGKEVDLKISWQLAVENVQEKLKSDPNNIYQRFNLSVAYYETGQYEKAIEEFEKVENQLPFRTLWYQIEPILAYFEVKNYDKLFSITDKILGNGNRAFSEVYVVRGNAYLDQGKTELAKEEFEKARLYNKNLKF